MITGFDDETPNSAICNASRPALTGKLAHLLGQSNKKKQKNRSERFSFTVRIHTLTLWWGKKAIDKITRMIKLLHATDKATLSVFMIEVSVP